ncbi:hypothetical protein Taro_034933 [Colocasia esculenta]|uniref:Uncharacterized protein n=1 Tax=Colocasia esculenta TaxID=4460 RepID=A0A843VZ31_COLES|nr:hypothetical protein [Colocasia esculenta]
MRAACHARSEATDVRSGKATPEAVAIWSRRPNCRDKVSCRTISWRCDQKAVMASVAIATEGFALHAFGVLVIRLSLFIVHGFVGSPRFCVSQAHECARGWSRCSGTIEVLLWWFGWSPQFFGFTCVVELQLDLTSMTARLRVLPVEMLHGVGTVVVVISEQRLTSCGLTGTCTLCGYWFLIVRCVLAFSGGEVEVVWTLPSKTWSKGLGRRNGRAEEGLSVQFWGQLGYYSSVVLICEFSSSSGLHEFVYCDAPQ